MKKIKRSTKFKKDLKRYKHDKVKLNKLSEVIHILEKGDEIPSSYKPHCLKGDYNGYLECHIEGDFLLIWLDKKNDVVCLERLGSHSELFD